MWTLYEIQILMSINQVLMEHSYASGLNIFHGCSLATRADVIGYNWNHMIWPFTGPSPGGLDGKESTWNQETQV